MTARHGQVPLAATSPNGHGPSLRSRTGHLARAWIAVSAIV